MTVMDELAEELKGGEPSPLLKALKTGEWLDSQRFPPLAYHVPGVLPEGSSLLVGPPKVGKSWFVLSVGLAAAAGGRALGLPVTQRPVLYLALEDGHRRLQDRCRALLGDQEPIPPAFEYMIEVEPGTVIATIEAWLDKYADAAPLVILDTLGKVMPPSLMGESAYQRDYRVGGALKRLADSRSGSAILTNHHDRKAAAEDFVDSVSGTHGLAGAADTIIVLSRQRQSDEGVLKVTGRDVAEGEYALTFNAPGSWHLVGDGLIGASAAATQRRVTANVGDVMSAVLGHVAGHPEGVTPKQVNDALGRDDARVYLARAAENGRLLKAGRGHYSPVTSVTSTNPAGQRPAERERESNTPVPSVTSATVPLTSGSNRGNRGNTPTGGTRRCDGCGTLRHPSDGDTPCPGCTAPGDKDEHFL